MSLINHWRERHPRPSGSGRVLVLIVLLIMVIIFIVKAPAIMRGFSAIFLPSQDSPVTVDE